MAITYEGITDQARQIIIHHHVVLRRGLQRRVGALCEAVESGVSFERLLTMRPDYLAGEILPHAEADERTLYQAAASQAGGSELMRELTGEHRELAHLAGRPRAGADGGEAATAAETLATLFAGHVAKGNDVLLPGLTGTGADLAARLAGMREQHAGAQA